MRWRTLAGVVVAAVVAGCNTAPDYVAETPAPRCDLRSRLVRRGYPENLEVLFAGNCTATRSDGMRGPDFTWWLGGGRFAFYDCETAPFPIRFWTEQAPDGKVTRIHFCPEFCQELLHQLKDELKNDVVCEPEGGASGVLPVDAGISSPFGPLGGSVAPTAGVGAATAGVGAAGFGEATGAAGVAGAVDATAGAGISGVGGVAGVAGAVPTGGIGAAGAGGAWAGASGGAGMPAAGAPAAGASGVGGGGAAGGAGF